LMRFTCPDTMSPFGAGGINAYAYCVGDPINLIDPTGHYVTGGVSSMALGRYGGATGGIILGLVGIVTSIATFGASVAAMGAVAASVALTLSLAAEATGIASLAIGDKDPELSANLGWASLGLGIAGSIGGAYKKPVKGSYNLPKNTDKLGNIADNQVLGFESKAMLSNNQKVYILEAKKNLHNDQAIIMGHGETIVGDHFTSTSTVHFYADVGEDLVTSDFYRSITNANAPMIYHTYLPNQPIPNMNIGGFRMSNNEGSLYSMDMSRLLIKNMMDSNLKKDLYLLESMNTVTLSQMMSSLEPNYTDIFIAACRRPGVV
ncbi:type IV secretion protein Rhs, partial [Myroides sp. 1354]|uniref:putative adhesin n=1 Tax=unclassified Myroides TaxID=2642485 RepID=UPI002577A045